MSEEELVDLARLLQGMIHPEASKRLSIQDLLLHSAHQQSSSSHEIINWLKSSQYHANNETEIGREIHARIHSGDSFLRVFDANRQSTSYCFTR